MNTTFNQTQTKTTTMKTAAWVLLACLLRPILAIHLDIHVPLPEGCLKYHALLANRLLRSASRQTGRGGDGDDGKLPLPSEGVDLFREHTPHVTLYLADFDLEVAPSAGGGADFAAAALNETKVSSFKGAISSLNFTEILDGWDCPLSFTADSSDGGAYYTINGAYTMLPIEVTPCLQTLSNALLHALQTYVKYPVSVPSWVGQLPEPERSAAIYRSRQYGSPNVLEGFVPHVTVGFDPAAPGLDASLLGVHDPAGELNDGASVTLTDQTNLQWRTDTMKEWNDLYKQARGTCVDEVQGIAMGKTGMGGTVLSNSRMGYWKVNLAPRAARLQTGNAVELVEEFSAVE